MKLTCSFIFLSNEVGDPAAAVKTVKRVKSTFSRRWRGPNGSENRGLADGPPKWLWRQRKEGSTCEWNSNVCFFSIRNRGMMIPMARWSYLTKFWGMGGSTSSLEIKSKSRKLLPVSAATSITWSILCAKGWWQWRPSDLQIDQSLLVSTFRLLRQIPKCLTHPYIFRAPVRILSISFRALLQEWCWTLKGQCALAALHCREPWQALVARNHLKPPRVSKLAANDSVVFTQKGGWSVGQ